MMKLSWMELQKMRVTSSQEIVSKTISCSHLTVIKGSRVNKSSCSCSCSSRIMSWHQSWHRSWMMVMRSQVRTWPWDMRSWRHWDSSCGCRSSCRSIHHNLMCRRNQMRGRNNEWSSQRMAKQSRRISHEFQGFSSHSFQSCLRSWLSICSINNGQFHQLPLLQVILSISLKKKDIDRRRGRRVTKNGWWKKRQK